MQNSADSGPGSFRQAILDVNANSPVGTYPVTIAFNIPASDPGYNATTGAFTIGLTSALPALTRANITIDGYTQAGASRNTLAAGDNAVLKIVLDGHDEILGSGLQINSAGVTITGLDIQGFAGHGIFLNAASNARIIGNFIGTDVSGTQAHGNTLSGIFVSGGGSNLIGTDGDGVNDAAERNVLSGNAQYGVNITSGPAESYLAEADQLLSGQLPTLAAATATISRLDFSDSTGPATGAWSVNNPIPGGGGDYYAVKATGVLQVNTAGTYSFALGSDDGSRLKIDGVLVAQFDTPRGFAVTYGTATLTAGAHTFEWVGYDLTGSSGFELSVAAGVNTTAVTAANGWRLVGDNTLPGNGLQLQGSIAVSVAYAMIKSFGLGQSKNIVAGNYIGTSKDGSAAIPNAVVGVLIQGSSRGNRIGTNGDGVADALERNIISGNLNYGVFITGAYLNTVAGNYIGTNVGGDAAIPNNLYGVYIQNGAQANVLGTNGDGVNDDAERNVISGNLSYGVRIESPGTSYNSVAGNYIGVNAAGLAPIANGSSGVLIYNGATFNTIGSNADGVADAAERNIIAGNNFHGVQIQSAYQNVIAGNWIGLAADGSPLGNAASGVALLVGAASNRIGSNGDLVNDAAERNVISGNKARGVLISDSGTINNLVAGNYIGTRPDGAMGPTTTTLAFSSTITGGTFLLTVAGVTTVPIVWSSAPATLAANIQAALDTLSTVGAGASSVSVTGLGFLTITFQNVLGVAVQPTVSATTTGLTGAGPTIAVNTYTTGNAADGVLITNGATGNTIGGSSTLANVIAFNRGAGIDVTTASTSGNAFSGNSIFSNVGQGIDLNGDNVTKNDAADADTGPNTLLNAPVITSARLDGAGNLVVSGFAPASPALTSYTGSLVLGAPGAIAGDTAATFGGTDNDYLISSSYSKLSSAVTVEMWLKTSATNQSGIFSYASSGFDNEFLISNPANLTVSIKNQSVVTGVSVNDGAWRHVAVTWFGSPSSGTLQIYKDGLLAFTTTLQLGQFLTPGGTIVLGQEQDTLGGGFDPLQKYVGSMDEVAIYDTSLSAQQIQSHFLAGAGYSGAVLADKPVTYWRLGDAPGATTPTDLGSAAPKKGAVIDLYLADNTGNSFGAGKTYLASLVEGSAQDSDATTGTYANPTIGADTANRFTFTIPLASLPATVNAASVLTATATVNGSTSEFSRDVNVKTADAAPVISATSVTPQIDENGFATLTVSYTDADTQDGQTATVNWGDGSVGGLTLTTGGSGFTSAPTVTLSGGGGAGAMAVASLGVTTATVTAGGGGYTTPPTVTFGASPQGTTATGLAVVNPVTGAVTAVLITNPGSGYTAPPTISFSGPGSGAAASPVLAVVGVSITSGGAGYTSAPAVAISGGGGSGATATASLTQTVSLTGATGLLSNPYTFGGHTYYVTKATSNWYDAEAQAQLMGGHLVTIGSQAENDFVQKMLISETGTNLTTAWIGLNDASNEGVFTWTSGEPLTYTNWLSGNPDNGSGGLQDHGYINFSAQGKWDDIEGRGTLNPKIAVIEVAPVKTFTVTHQYRDNGAPTVSVTVADTDGAALSASSSATVTVNNATPQLVTSYSAGATDQKSAIPVVDATANLNNGYFQAGPISLGAAGALSGDADTAYAFAGGQVAMSIPQLNSGAGTVNSVSLWMKWNGSNSGSPMPLGFTDYDLIFQGTGFGFNTAGGDLYGLNISGTVSAATNAGPIVVTSTNHGLATGDKVSITGATGNTAANGAWTVTVIDANTFSLNGSTGNGSYNANSGAWAKLFGPNQTPLANNWHHVAAVFPNNPGSLSQLQLYIDGVLQSLSQRAGTTNATRFAGAGVTSVTITNGGSGYTSAPTVTFSAPPATGLAISTATGLATITNGVVTSVTIINPGFGYTSTPPTITFSGGNGSGAAATATVAPTVRLSGWVRDTNNRFTGSLDEVAFFNRQLSAADVSAQVGATGAGYSATVQGQSPVAYYRLGESGTPQTANDQLGSALAVIGNVLYVGAPLDDSGAADAGAVYAYDATTGAFLSRIQKATPVNGDQFGKALAVVGAKLLIGAPFDDTGASNAGAVYVYDPANSALTLVRNPFPGPSDQFGTSVAAVGNNFVVGAPFADTGVVTDAGAAYLFDGSSLALLQSLRKPKFSLANAATGQNDGALSGAVNLGSFVSAVTITNGGSGYTSVPGVIFTAPNGSGATATAIVSGGVIIGVQITNGGSGYTSPPSISFSGGGGIGAAATATVGGALPGDSNTAMQFFGGTAALAVPGLQTAANAQNSVSFWMNWNGGFNVEPVAFTGYGLYLQNNTTNPQLRLQHRQ
ncbi:MAG: LamG-like jellyroll fold domain-containing protein [Gemmataceae bacterium]